MIAYIDESRCTGCGRCVSVCSEGAIELDGTLAYIDGHKCVGCQACIEVCPSGAILSLTEPSLSEPLPQTAARAPSPALVRAQAGGLLSLRRLAPWLGAGLAFAGREIIPPLVEYIYEAWDGRQARRSTKRGRAGAAPMTSGRAPIASSRGSVQHRRRRRGA